MANIFDQYFDDEKKKKETPSQQAATINKSGNRFDSYFDKTVTPQEQVTRVQSQPVQDNTNIFKSAVSAVSNAVSSIFKKPEQQPTVQPQPQPDNQLSNVGETNIMSNLTKNVIDYVIDKEGNFVKNPEKLTPEETTINPVTGRTVEQMKGDVISQGSSKVPNTWEKIKEFVSKPFKQSQEEQIARAQIVTALQKRIAEKNGLKQYQVDADVIDRNLDAITKEEGLRTGVGTTSEFLNLMATLAIPFGLVSAPAKAITTLIGASAVVGAKEAIVDKATGKQPGAPISTLLPSDTSQGVKDIADVLDFVGTGLLIHGFSKMTPKVQTFVTKQVMTDYSIPQTVTIDPSQARTAQGIPNNKPIAPYELDIIKKAGLTSEQWKQALLQGIKIEVPTEKIITISDRPYWSKIKGAFGIPESTPQTIVEKMGTRVTNGAPAGLLPERAGSIVFTPEEALANVKGTDLSGTTAGDAILEAVTQAQKAGKDISISVGETGKLTGVTPEGNKVSISLVDKKPVLQELSVEGGNPNPTKAPLPEVIKNEVVKPTLVKGTEPVTLYRGMNPDRARSGVAYEKGVTFYTTDKQTAMDYANSQSDDRVTTLRDEKKGLVEKIASTEDNTQVQEMQQRILDINKQIQDIQKEVNANPSAKQVSQNKGKLVEVTNPLKNPLVVDANGQTFDVVTEQAIKQARAEGRDGVVINNVIDSINPENAKPITTVLQFEEPVAPSNKAQSVKNTEALRQDALDGKLESRRFDENNISILEKAMTSRGFEFPENPTGDSMVKVYRAGTSEIKPGDYVTLVKSRAESFLKQREGSTLYEAEVPLKDLIRSDGLNTDPIYAPKGNNNQLSNKNATEGIVEPTASKGDNNNKLDATRMQEIRNSLEEGENILRTKSFNGKKLSDEELEVVKRSVASEKKKLGIADSNVSIKNRDGVVVDKSVKELKTGDTLVKDGKEFTVLESWYNSDGKLFGSLQNTETMKVRTYNLEKFNTPTVPGGEATTGAYEPMVTNGGTVEERVAKIKPMEFPEILSMARELETMPSITNKFTTALGKFYHATDAEGNVLDKRIKLSADIFTKDSKLAAKVLAHELGHLTDFLPDNTLKRGNILGRIATLREYMKATYEDLENSVVREELKKMTKLWNPFDENANDKYTKYRFSSKELYAEAISVLFNDPALLKETAPTFWKGFFDYLDLKPEAMQTFLDTWDLINLGEDELFKARNETLNKMFDRAEDAFYAKELEKSQRKSNLLFEVKLLIDNKNQAIIDKVNQAVKSGKDVPDELNPRFALADLNYIEGSIKNYVADNFQPIFEKAQKVEDGWNSLGKVLLLERAINERGDMANPGGFDRKTAQEQLNFIRDQMKPEEWKAIQEAKDDFRKAVQKSTDMWAKERYYSPEIIEQMKANPAYATFQVVDYLDTYISPKIHKSMGTLKDVANPATSTVIKLISTFKAVETNKAKKTVVDFQKAFFPEEIQPAKTRFNGTAQEVVEPKEKDLGLLTVIRDGKVEGHYVDKYIANSLNYVDNTTLKTMARVVRVISKASFYRPLFTTINLGFQSFNLVRDFSRYWKGIPDKNLGEALTSFPRALYRYGQAVKPAWAAATGTPNEVIKAMENKKILGLSFNELRGDVDPEDTQIERVMQRAGLRVLEPKKAFVLFRPFLKVMDGIETLGDFLEKLPKVAGYKELYGKMPEREMASFIRTRIGSPDFREAGTLTPATNSIFLFSNAIIKGMKYDFLTATQPRTRAGFWWKTFLTNMFPKLLLMAAATGYLGKKLKDVVDGATEYDKTNYNIIPLGTDEFGQSIYIRVPQDESGRLLGGITWKILRMANKEDLKIEDMFQLVDFGAGQFPNMSPIFTGIGATLEYFSGRNPYDSFRGRNVIPDNKFQAGFKYSFPYFLQWLAKNQGASIIMPNYGNDFVEDRSGIQKILDLPVLSNVLGRWIKVTSYGKTEQGKEVLAPIKQQEAAKREDTNEAITKAVKEFKAGDPSMVNRNRIEKDLVKKLVGDAPYNKDEKLQVSNIKKKFRLTVLRGGIDPNVDVVLSATTKAQQIAALKDIKSKMSKREYDQFIKQLFKYEAISSEVVKAAK